MVLEESDTQQPESDHTCIYDMIIVSACNNIIKLFCSMKAAEESATEVTIKKEVTDTQHPVSEYPGNDDYIGIITHVISIIALMLVLTIINIIVRTKIIIIINTKESGTRATLKQVSECPGLDDYIL